MHHCTCIAATFGALALLLAASSTSAASMPVILCPAGLKEVPAALRQLCITVMARDAPPEDANGGDVYESPIYDHDIRGVKRQDVDHVFLRFGRRYGL